MHISPYTWSQYAVFTPWKCSGRAPVVCFMNINGIHTKCGKRKKKASTISQLTCALINEIYNNAWVTVNKDFMIASEVICQWFSRVTKSRVKIIGKSHHAWPKKSLFTVRNVLLFYFLHTMLCPEHTIGLKTIVDRSIRQGRSFLTQHCDVTTIDLWRHANTTD